MAQLEADLVTIFLRINRSIKIKILFDVLIAPFLRESPLLLAVFSLIPHVI